MDPKLPDGFVSLQKASNSEGQFLNLMGVVADFLPITQSRGTGKPLEFYIVVC